jgi:hypothetical protein
MQSRALIVALALTVASGAPDISARQTSSPFIGWVGLFTRPLVDWLENENLLAKLCPGLEAGAIEGPACREKVLVRLRRAPSPSSAHVGDLVIDAAPGKGLRASYVQATGGAAVPFEPDLWDGDWGYGPYFHETVVERRGEWVRLPEDPFPPSTWLDTTTLEGGSSLLALEAERIVTSPEGDLFIIAVGSDHVRARPEQEQDMWCRSEPPPPLKPFTELRLDGPKLYTSTGHLRLRIKYTRGC